MSQTKIEWSEKVWNTVTGCDKLSQGCKFCYAEIMSKRLMAMGQEKYKNNFKVTLHPYTLDKPRSWKKPALIFVNSMSDLFHDEVPIEYIKRVFEVMNETPRHTYQVLTKRSERLAMISHELNWTSNIWMGVSVENSDAVHRISDLKKCGAQTKFVSAEPLIGSLGKMNLTNIDWMIVGGESGHKPRPINKEWVLGIKDQCAEDKVAFFFKQWGGKNKKAAGRLLGGREYNEMPKRKDR